MLHVLQELAGTPNAPTLRSKIASIVPDFSLPDDYATAHATLDDALAHILGTGTYNLGFGGEEEYTLKDAVRTMRYVPMTAEFREKHQYLNVGYLLLQHVVETLSGQPFDEYLDQHFWKPLGMDSTFIKLPDALKAINVLATGHSWEDREKKLVFAPYKDDGPLVGDGGMITSIKDFATYIKAVVHKQLPLQPAFYDELFRPRCISGDPQYDHFSTQLYGAGWVVTTYRGHRVYSHSGGTVGFTSKMAVLPDLKWGVAILSNTDLNGAFSNELILMRLIDEYLGVPQDQRQDFVSTLETKWNAMLQSYAKGRETAFPDLPSPPLPPTLPLEAYAGAYRDPGNKTMRFSLQKPPAGLPVGPDTKQVLHASLPALWDLTLDLEHASGDYFYTWVDTQTGSAIVRIVAEAKFEIGSDGKVRGVRLSVDAECDMLWLRVDG